MMLIEVFPGPPMRPSLFFCQELYPLSQLQNAKLFSMGGVEFGRKGRGPFFGNIPDIRLNCFIPSSLGCFQAMKSVYQGHFLGNNHGRPARLA